MRFIATRTTCCVWLRRLRKRALMSLRLEKGWGAWGLDFRPDFDAVESGMDAFIDWKKDFTAKAAGPTRRFVTITIDVDGIDVSGDEAVLCDGAAVGYISSGGYAHHVGRSMAMGYVAVIHAGAGTMLEIEILGQMYPAEVRGEPLYDPGGMKMRG